MGAIVPLFMALAVHPLHTTLTQLAYRDADRSVEVTVRVFADDFRAVLARDVSDSAAAAYLRSAFTLTDREPARRESRPRDRKSTRLNSSHGRNSYAVF